MTSFRFKDRHHLRNPRRSSHNRLVALGAVAGTLLAGLAYVATAQSSPAASSDRADLDSTSSKTIIGPCRAVDGDTLRCGAERIRLLGIDAPELPGHCRQGRVCAPGDPFASAYTLTRDLLPVMTIDRVSLDRYGRTLATVSAAGQDLSCLQLETRHAIYRPDWDNGQRVARLCPRAARDAD